MARFKDKSGRQWLLGTTGDRLRDVRKATGIDLRQPRAFEQMNQEQAAAVLFAFAAGEIEAHGLNQTDVSRDFGPLQIANALEAIKADLEKMR